jgi:large subunit ribosomal protein L25
MNRLQLSAQTRDDLRKSTTKRLRREGYIPATVYGKNEESKAIAVPADKLTQILKTPGGRLSLIDLEIDGKSANGRPVLIQEIQRHPITKQILHIDFHRVSLDEPVVATVPVVLVGEAPGTEQGGILEQFTHELHVRALPDRLPTHIDVDVSHLGLGDTLHVEDIKLPEGVELVDAKLDNVVATVRLPVVHLEAAEVEEAETEEAEKTASAKESSEQ